jgi:hypothetical protein
MLINFFAVGVKTYIQNRSNNGINPNPAIVRPIKNTNKITKNAVARALICIERANRGIIKNMKLPFPASNNPIIINFEFTV